MASAETSASPPGARRGRTLLRCLSRAAVLTPVAALLLAAAATAAPLDVYGRLPGLEEVALSPDGSRIAFVKTEGNTRVVVAVSLAGHAGLGGVRLRAQKLRSIQWADNDRLLIGTSVTTVPIGFVGEDSEWDQLDVFDVRNGRQFQVPEPDTLHGVEILNIIAGRVMIRRLHDHTVLFFPGLQVVGGESSRALIRVDLDSHESRVVRVGRPGNLGWIVDEAGEVQAEETYADKDGRWSILLRQDGHLREIASGKEALDYPELLGWGPTPDSLLLQMMEKGDPVWKLISIKDGAIGPPMAGTETLNRTIEHPQTNRMIGGVRIADTEEYVFFDPGLQQSWDTIRKAFPGERVHYEGAAANFRKVIVRVEGAHDGFRYELIDLDAHSATSVGDVYAGVTQPFEVRRVTYAAGDGTQIPAYLTLPRDKPPGKLPLIVMPHGGPEARDTADFDWWSQALADQGYAVLRPNYRGSSISWEFVNAGFGQFGRKMQTDLSDGVRYLVSQGLVDPARVCIVGASYGGYAALAGVSLDPGTYRCAVSVAGIADLRQFLKVKNQWDHLNRNHATRYWGRYMGVSGADDPALDAISPIKHLAAISVPVLLVHGRDDTVVPFEQSQLIYDALRGAHKDVQLVTLKNEDHWLSRGETRLQMLKESVAFLRAHNPPD
jgi:dipeptidyl aminopeptidase/acylaminoacyl peptidase